MAAACAGQSLQPSHRAATPGTPRCHLCWPARLCQQCDSAAPPHPANNKTAGVLCPPPNNVQYGGCWLRCAMSAGLRHVHVRLLYASPSLYSALLCTLCTALRVLHVQCTAHACMHSCTGRHACKHAALHVCLLLTITWAHAHGPIHMGPCMHAWAWPGAHSLVLLTRPCLMTNTYLY